MSILYLIRHAESEANRSRILASRLPYPLSTSGMEDARRIASELKAITRLDEIISSPLLRARQTADCFSRAYADLPVKEDIRLAEQDLGAFSGMSYDEVKVMDDYEKNTRNRWNWIPRGGGESYAMIAERVSSFFQAMAKKKPDQRILVVTHAVVFRLIRGLLDNTLPSYPSSFPNNGEIWKVDYSGRAAAYTVEQLFLGNSRDFIHNP